ncbi:class I SAM-dependent methyltransferase [Candidatus Woesearchaeota archaeon]|nr:class I SAM-dependent methyltransferase [Candidatus Woesearchaeota archaeon]
MASLLEQTIRTYSQNAAHFAEHHTNTENWQPMFDRFRTYLPSGRVLDLGSAHCRDGQLFVPAGYEYIALDACKELLDLATTPVQRVQGNILSLPFANQTFDGVWACASLLHIPKKDLRQSLAEIKRVSASNSCYFISIKAGMHEKPVRGAYATPRFFAFYTHDEFSNQLGMAGMTILEHYNAYFDLRPPDNFTVWLCYLCRPA